MKPKLLQRSSMPHGGLRFIQHYSFLNSCCSHSKTESKWDQNSLNLLKSKNRKEWTDLYLCVCPIQLLSKGRTITPHPPLETFFSLITNSYPGLPLLFLAFSSIWNPLLCSPVGLNAAHDSSQSSSRSIASSWLSFWYLCFQSNLYFFLTFLLPRSTYSFELFV